MATTARRPRAELQKAAPKGVSAPSAGQDAALLAVKKRILDQGLVIQQFRLYRRLFILWLVIGTPLLVGLVVTGNLLIDYSRPGGGRFALNFFGTILTFMSLCASSVAVFDSHHTLQAKRNELAKLIEEKSLLSSMNAIGAAASQRGTTKKSTASLKSTVESQSTIAESTIPFNRLSSSGLSLQRASLVRLVSNLPSSGSL